MVTREKIYELLKNVLDPEYAIDIVSLGLIYDVEIDGRTIRVTMTLTSLGCPMGPVIESGIQEQLRDVEGIESVEIVFVFDPPWDPSMMSEESRLMLQYLL